MLTLASGEVRAGEDLRAIVQQARAVRGLIDQLHSRYDRRVVEQAAIVGGFDPEALSDQAAVATLVERVVRRLDRLSEETERGWQGQAGEDGGLFFERTVRGVREVHALDPALIGSVDARHLNAHAASLDEIYSGVAVLNRKGEDSEVHGPRDLLDFVFAAGRKGISQMQRYKGLGEMNPDQLWETTLDPDARTLLRVQINDADGANTIFASLMGDEVAPRRDFIQENALSVANLDV